MRYTIFSKLLLTAFAATVLFSSCKKDDDNNQPNPEPTFGLLKLRFENMVIQNNRNEELVLSSTTGAAAPDVTSWYLNDNVDTFTVNQLRYFVGNFVFVKEDGTEFLVDKYYLIQRTATTNDETFVIDGVPTGKYVSVKFKVGVKPEDNATLSSGGKGELVVGDGMNWTWATGYIFFKQEGQYFKNGEWLSYGFHLGTDKAYAPDYITSTIPNGVTVQNADTSSIHYHVDVNALFGLKNHTMHGSTVMDISEKAMIHGYDSNYVGNWAAHMFMVDHGHEPAHH